MNIANQITYFRIILIPFFVVFFYIPQPWGYKVAALIYIIAAMTDWLDGYIARKYKQVSHLGTFLDPVADKMMVIVALILLVELYHTWVITLPVSIIVLREVVVISLRQWAAELKMSHIGEVSTFGKVKTGFQISAIIAILLFDSQSFPLLNIGAIITMYVAAVLSLYSMSTYIYRAKNNLTGSN